jgi:hypothetical protein
MKTGQAINHEVLELEQEIKRLGFSIEWDKKVYDQMEDESLAKRCRQIQIQCDELKLLYFKAEFERLTRRK